MLYDFIPDDQLSTSRLTKYALVILPNIRCMSDGEITALKDYVREGGALLATFASSLFDQDGKERADFGLAEVFGCSYAGKKVNTRKDNYQYIAQPHHPLVIPDSDKTELLINAGYTLLCKPHSGARIICTYVPTVHNQPPEKAWAEGWSTEFPTVMEHQYGQGKVLYFANQPDQVTYEMGHPDMRNLLLRGIRYLLSSAGILESTAPESVHITLTQSQSDLRQYLLSLVNTTSGAGRPVRRLVPVTDIEVILRLGEKKLSYYQILRTQGDCMVRGEDEQLRIQINQLEDFCSIYLQMEG